ncbi:MAG: hypothetical protein J0L84_18235 [Verrucomicrobia bacterium]|nr:hypothetical protein [Verrucomicrobiota bacterium]
MTLLRCIALAAAPFLLALTLGACTALFIRGCDLTLRATGAASAIRK